MLWERDDSWLRLWERDDNFYLFISTISFNHLIISSTISTQFQSTISYVGQLADNHDILSIDSYSDMTRMGFDIDGRMRW